MPYRLLVVEDDNRLSAIIRDYFVAKGFSVDIAADGSEALTRLDENEYDIFFLDIMMPHIDGYTVCRTIRSKSDMPIVFLTAMALENNMLLGYKAGADDYITKPFSLPVLHLKALSLLKRTKGMLDTTSYSFDGLVVNAEAQTVTADSQNVELAPKEYSLLLYLVQNKNIVLSRERILNAVWGHDYYGNDRAVDTHIKKLRQALGKHSWRIKTIMKMGYRFEDRGN